MYRFLILFILILKSTVVYPFVSPLPYELMIKAMEERNERIRQTNLLTDNERNSLLEEKYVELKFINAILSRYKEDFRKVREQKDQDGQHTKVKVKEIFKNDLWKYEPLENLKNLDSLLEHIRGDYFNDENLSKEQKIILVKEKISHIKDKLIYLRDFSVRRGVPPWNILVYLYHTDIRLAVHKHNKDWDKYNEVLRELDIVHKI